YHPFALHATLREDNQQSVVNLNGSLYLLVKLLAALYVFGGEPHTHLLVAHARIKPTRKLFVSRAVADEAGVELYRLLYVEVGGDEGYEIVGDAAAAQEGFGYLPGRFIAR